MIGKQQDIVKVRKLITHVDVIVKEQKVPLVHTHANLVSHFLQLLYL